MSSRLTIIIFPLTFLFFFCFFGCHSIPPTTPKQNDGPLDLRSLPWQNTSIPDELSGHWYYEGQLYLTILEYEFQVQRSAAELLAVAKADSFFRIIYKVGELHKALYLNELSEDGLKLIVADSSATDAAGAVSLPAGSNWLFLTPSNPWIQTSVADGIYGNWHIRDGLLEMMIKRDSMVMEGQSWQIELLQTNRHVDRFVLKKGEDFKTLYFRELGTYSMEIILADGLVDLQDKYGNVNGNWRRLAKWWDFIETMKFHQGSRWTYDYDFWRNYNFVENSDSITLIDMVSGQIDLEVVSNTVQGAQGELVLSTTCRIDTLYGLRYNARQNGELQVLTDSSWSLADTVINVQHKITLENDSLWYATAEGKLPFASMKLQPGVRVFLRAYVYPFDLGGIPISHSLIYAGVLLADVDPGIVGSNRSAFIEQERGLTNFICSDTHSETPLQEFEYKSKLLSFSAGT